MYVYIYTYVCMYVYIYIYYMYVFDPWMFPGFLPCPSPKHTLPLSPGTPWGQGDGDPCGTRQHGAGTDQGVGAGPRFDPEGEMCHGTKWMDEHDIWYIHVCI